MQPEELGDERSANVLDDDEACGSVSLSDLTKDVRGAQVRAETEDSRENPEESTTPVVREQKSSQRIGLEDDKRTPGGVFGPTVSGEHTGANLVQEGESDYARDRILFLGAECGCDGGDEADCLGVTRQWRRRIRRARVACDGGNGRKKGV